jgi:MFS family permease
VPAENPASFSLWRVIAYLLKIPTYRLLVLASSLGYYFFAGIRAFGMIYFTQHYHVSRSTMGALIVLVGIGAVAGVTFGGRFSEWLLRRGVPEARIIVPATALLTAAVLLVPAIWSTNLIVGIMFLVLGTAALSTANPPIDAARLDIVPPGLWGRGEAGRMALRGVLEGGAPILFGAISEAVGLELTFLIMLLPLVAASALGIPAYRSYPRDVATAQATFERHRKGSAA